MPKSYIACFKLAKVIKCLCAQFGTAARMFEKLFASFFLKTHVLFEVKTYIIKCFSVFLPFMVNVVSFGNIKSVRKRGGGDHIWI